MLALFFAWCILGGLAVRGHFEMFLPFAAIGGAVCGMLYDAHAKSFLHTIAYALLVLSPIAASAYLLVYWCFFR